MALFKKIGKGLKKFGKFTAKVTGKILPVVKLATGIIPGGKFVDKIVDKAAGGLTKLGGPMKNSSGAKRLVGAIGMTTNPRQTLHPLMYKGGHPNRAVGAAGGNMQAGSWRENLATGVVDDDEVVNADGTVVKKAGGGMIALIVLVLVVLGTMFRKKR